MARNYEFHNSIFVPQLDLTSGNVVHFDGKTAPIALILAHEMTHTSVKELMRKCALGQRRKQVKHELLYTRNCD